MEPIHPEMNFWEPGLLEFRLGVIWRKKWRIYVGTAVTILFFVIGLLMILPILGVTTTTSTTTTTTISPPTSKIYIFFENMQDIIKKSRVLLKAKFWSKF